MEHILHLSDLILSTTFSNQDEKMKVLSVGNSVSRIPLWNLHNQSFNKPVLNKSLSHCHNSMGINNSELLILPGIANGPPVPRRIGTKCNSKE